MEGCVGETKYGKKWEDVSKVVCKENSNGFPLECRIHLEDETCRTLELGEKGIGPHEIEDKLTTGVEEAVVHGETRAKSDGDKFVFTSGLHKMGCIRTKYDNELNCEIE